MNNSGNDGQYRAKQSHPATSWTHPSRGLVRSLALGMAGTGVLLLGTAGCKSQANPATIVTQGAVAQNGQDPAAANMAQPYMGGSAGGYNAASQPNHRSTRVLGASQSYPSQASGESYPQNEQAYGYAQNGYSQSGYAGSGYGQDQAAPIVRQTPSGAQDGYGDGYADAEEAGEQAIAETDQAPPPLPEYDQPPAPDANDLWTPGYWNYASTGYYWVPGVWCAPPFYGALWTPPWWGFGEGRYRFHRGYWGPHIGYYGGINYGFGYVGTGYYGGYWRGRDFYYNRAVTNVNITRVRNVYERPVVVDGRQYGPRPMDRTSYNGGRGGLTAQPRPAELAADREAHYAPVAAQRDNRLNAAANRAQFFQANGGRPAQAFANRPIGPQGGIAEAPREQPFNRPGNQHLVYPGPLGTGERSAMPAGVRPGVPDNRAGGFQSGARQSNTAQPGATQPAGRPGFANQQPGFANQQPGYQHPGSQQQGGFQQPGFANQQPGYQRPGSQQGGFQHPGSPQQNPQPNPQPGGQPQPGNRPNLETRQGTPAYSGTQPASPSQPGSTPSSVRPGFDNRQTGVPPAGNRPNFYNRQQLPTTQPANRPNPAQQPAVAQPAIRPDARPDVQTRQPGFQQPGFQQPGFQQPGFQQPGNRPNFDYRQAAPAPPPRPAPTYAPRSEPVPQSRPQAAPAPAPRPAPAPQAAPHGGGGAPHGEHGR